MIRTVFVAALAQVRLETDAADYSVAESRTVFTRNFTVSFAQRSQANPPMSQLAGGQGQVTNDVSTYGTALRARLDHRTAWADFERIQMAP